MIDYLTIPSKDRPEWEKMITGEIDHDYRNYVLQMRIYQLRRDLKNHKITKEAAIDNLYALCSKYVLAVQSDFKIIFISW